MLPLVLPPVVTGYLLLRVLGRSSPLGPTVARDHRRAHRLHHRGLRHRRRGGRLPAPRREHPPLDSRRRPAPGAGLALARPRPPRHLLPGHPAPLPPGRTRRLGAQLRARPRRVRGDHHPRRQHRGRNPADPARGLHPPEHSRSGIARAATHRTERGPRAGRRCSPPRGSPGCSGADRGPDDPGHHHPQDARFHPRRGLHVRGTGSRRLRTLGKRQDHPAPRPRRTHAATTRFGGDCRDDPLPSVPAASGHLPRSAASPSSPRTPCSSPTSRPATTSPTLREPRGSSAARAASRYWTCCASAAPGSQPGDALRGRAPARRDRPGAALTPSLAPSRRARRGPRRRALPRGPGPAPGSQARARRSRCSS